MSLTQTTTPVEAALVMSERSTEVAPEIISEWRQLGYRHGEEAMPFAPGARAASRLGPLQHRLRVTADRVKKWEAAARAYVEAKVRLLGLERRVTRLQKDLETTQAAIDRREASYVDPATAGNGTRPGTANSLSWFNWFRPLLPLDGGLGADVVQIVQEHLHSLRGRIGMMYICVACLFIAADVMYSLVALPIFGATRVGAVSPIGIGALGTFQNWPFALIALAIGGLPLVVKPAYEMLRFRFAQGMDRTIFIILLACAAGSLYLGGMLGYMRSGYIVTIIQSNPSRTYPFSASDVHWIGILLGIALPLFGAILLTEGMVLWGARARPTGSKDDKVPAAPSLLPDPILNRLNARRETLRQLVVAAETERDEVMTGRAIRKALANRASNPPAGASRPAHVALPAEDVSAITRDFYMLGYLDGQRTGLQRDGFARYVFRALGIHAMSHQQGVGSAGDAADGALGIHAMLPQQPAGSAGAAAERAPGQQPGDGAHAMSQQPSVGSAGDAADRVDDATAP